jgi:hypothetical protein
MTGPTAAALVRELEAHMVMLLLDDPLPLVKVPEHFLTYWRELLARLQSLIDTAKGREEASQKG